MPPQQPGPVGGIEHARQEVDSLAGIYGAPVADGIGWWSHNDRRGTRQRLSTSAYILTMLVQRPSKYSAFSAEKPAKAVLNKCLRAWLAKAHLPHRSADAFSPDLVAHRLLPVRLDNWRLPLPSNYQLTAIFRDTISPFYWLAKPVAS